MLRYLQRQSDSVFVFGITLHKSKRGRNTFQAVVKHLPSEAGLA